jgi:hypothetical protein
MNDFTIVYADEHCAIFRNKFGMFSANMIGEKVRENTYNVLDPQGWYTWTDGWEHEYECETSYTVYLKKWSDENGWVDLLEQTVKYQPDSLCSFFNEDIIKMFSDRKTSPQTKNKGLFSILRKLCKK